MNVSCRFFTVGMAFAEVVGARAQEDMVWPFSRYSEEGPTPIEWRMLPFWYTPPGKIEHHLGLILTKKQSETFKKAGDKALFTVPLASKSSFHATIGPSRVQSSRCTKVAS